MPVLQSPGAHLKNEKTPTPSQRYDRNAAIWLQKQMATRQTSPIRYDPISANFMTPIKSVTIRQVILIVENGDRRRPRYFELPSGDSDNRRSWLLSSWSGRCAGRQSPRITYYKRDYSTNSELRQCDKTSQICVVYQAILQEPYQSRSH